MGRVSTLSRRLGSPSFLRVSTRLGALSGRSGESVGAVGAGRRIFSRGWGAILAVCAAVLLGLQLGHGDFTGPDEGRYAQVSEELRSLDHGLSGLLVMHLNGEVYDQKPPLYFWLAALAGSPTGHVSELSARLPSALAGIATVLLVMVFGRHLLGREAGLAGGFVLLTTIEFALLARRASLDVLLAFFETLALAAFWMAQGPTSARRRWIGCLHAAMGLAVLTKGPVGFVIPLVVIGIYLGWERRLRELRALLPPWALLLSLGPGLVWLGAVTLLGPNEFLVDTLTGNLMGRVIPGGHHSAPIYFYLTKLPQLFLPWTLAWPVMWHIGRTHVFGRSGQAGVERAWRFLLVWLGASLVFFSLVAGKRVLYLLPLQPAVALLCGDALVRWLRGRSALPTVARGVLVAGAAAIAVGAPLLYGFGRLGSGATALLVLLAGAALLGVTLWLDAHRRLALRRTLALLGLGLIAIESAYLVEIFPAQRARRSLRPAAVAAAALTPEPASIGLYQNVAILGGIAYYSGRRVASLASPDAVRDLLDVGAAVIVQKKHLAELGAAVPLAVHVETADALVVVTAPSAATAPGPR